MLGNYTLDKSVLDNSSSAIEVSLVSNHGFWLLTNNEELFLAYADFPWFKQATIEQLTDVKRPSENHLYWPVLDIDLSLESVRDPSKFPLISNLKPH